MFAIVMHVPTPAKIPTLLAFMAGCCIFIFATFVVITGQTPTPVPATTDVFTISRELFLWVLAAGGFISLLLSIGYGFMKKEKYDRIEKDRDEWKAIADGREERIKELKYTHAEAEANWKLKLASKDQDITNLRESNGAVVSLSLQMKAILRTLRLNGMWQGHEERLHEVQQDEQQ